MRASYPNLPTNQTPAARIRLAILGYSDTTTARRHLIGYEMKQRQLFEKQRVEKRCPLCKEIKSANEFSTKKTDGSLHCWCKVCCIKKSREWYHANKDKHREYQRKWAAKNRDKTRARNKAYARRHPEQIKEKDRRFKERRPDYSRDWRLQKIHGITLAQFNDMLFAQGGSCAVCGTSSPGAHFKNLLVDHDHDTGMVRGLVCNDCNLLLGHAKDSPSLLHEAAAYLVRWNKQ